MVGEKDMSFDFGMQGNARIDAVSHKIQNFTERLWAMMRIKQLIEDMQVEENTTLKQEMKAEALALSLK